jgi:molybdate transport system substrate-binding protein
MTARRLCLWVVSLALFFCACSKQDLAEEGKPAALVVYAAASLRDVLGDISAAFARQGGGEVVFNFAGSNVLAQQIIAAPSADLFVAANEDWIEKLVQRGHLVAASQRVLAANALVLVAHAESDVRLARIEDLPSLSFTHLAVGDPSSVPAGIYARTYLSSVRSADADTWTLVAPRLAPAPDVRAALAMVEANRQVVGVVYRTDALASDRVKVLLEVPIDRKGATVRYYAALVKSGRQHERARKLLSFLQGELAQTIFAKHGFLREASAATAPKPEATPLAR